MDMIIRNCVCDGGVGKLSRDLARRCPRYPRAVHLSGQAGIRMRWGAAIYPHEGKTGGYRLGPTHGSINARWRCDPSPFELVHARHAAMPAIHHRVVAVVVVVIVGGCVASRRVMVRCLFLGAVRSLRFSRSARGRVTAFYATGEASGTYRSCLGTLDFGEEAAIARCSKAGLTLFGCGSHGCCGPPRARHRICCCRRRR